VATPGAPHTHIHELLVVQLLQRQGELHGVQGLALVRVVELRDGGHESTQDNLAAALVLVLKQLLGVATLLLQKN